MSESGASAPRVAVTCKHMQRDIEPYRHLFTDRGYELVIPPVPGQELAGDELVQAMDGVIGVIAGDDHFSRAVLDQLPDLTAIAKWGIGMDGIDHAAAADHHITVTNTPGMFNDEVAEMALGYLIAVVRGIVQTDRTIRAGGWPNPVGRSLNALTVTVLGLGNIGLSLAMKCAVLGMPVRGIDPGAAAQAAAADAGIETLTLADALPTTDILIVTAPLNDATRGLIGTDEIAAMPAGSILINVGRGPIVKNAAVAAALASGHLSGAALDVFEEEPLPAGEELRSHDNCILGSHNSSNTLEACHRTHAQATQNLFDSLDAA